jgi:hypothetical protein
VIPILTLIAIGIGLGAAMLWVFRLTSNQEAIRDAKRRLQAHLYELRLFTDEPALIWKAQWGLLKANTRYLALVMVPALVMVLPMLLLFSRLDCVYGHAPLTPGTPAILTLQTRFATSALPGLHVPDGIAVESPAIRIDGGRQISWRIRPLRPVTGELRIAFPSETAAKSIVAGTGLHYLSERRVSSLVDLLWYPAESRLAAGPIEWIDLRYPKATVHGFGLDLHWLIWLVLFSMMAALLLKRRFGVTL